MNTLKYPVFVKSRDCQEFTKIQPLANHSLPISWIGKPILVKTIASPLELKRWKQKSSFVEIMPGKFVSFDSYLVQTISLDFIERQRRVLQFNPPLYFTNVLPCPMQVSMTSDVNKKTWKTIFPGKSIAIYSIVPTDMKARRF
jgi:hypothetical protein